uniref:Chalcone synthase n=1 Tax=Oryza barthii TaxID=65489 RepID=A0A0D3HMI5_9ORYZ
MPHAATVVNDAVQPRRAAMLAIGTANPPNSLSQEEYTNWYFRVTNSDHLTNLKDKMKKICKFLITKCSCVATELAVRDQPSLDARQDILATVVPELAAAAAARAIAEWGRPASDVTHLVFTTYSGVRMPGGDLRLASLLGLRRSVQRTSMYFHGCSAAAALRVAKDLAENNPGARVLVVSAELSLTLFRAPQDGHVDTVVGQALFGDGAGAVIVGAGGDERQVFEMVSAAQTVLPDSEGAAEGQLNASGLVFRPSFELPAMVRDNVEQCLAEGVGKHVAHGGWNDLFWAVHPGGRKILDVVEERLALAPGKLDASRRVLSEYGNMSGASIIFVLDELRRRGDMPPGGLGVMLGIGPGISIEMMLLRVAAA